MSISTADPELPFDPATPVLEAPPGEDDPSALRFDPQAYGEEEADRFRKAVLGWYARNARPMPWRETTDPWAILVSEIMLQQTQTSRVEPRYKAWMERFPDAAALAAAPVDEILRLWSGLGYNRRALALATLAAQIVRQSDGRLPEDEAALRELPGVGRYTAAAVAAFAFGQPSVVVETNIRAVFIHHFYHEADRVPEKDIEALVAASVDKDDPRNWYYALMDYGVYIKKRFGNPSRRASVHATQTPFATSTRRLRGQILRSLAKEGPREVGSLEVTLPFSRERVHAALGDLVAEGFVEYRGERVALATKLREPTAES